MLLDLLLPDPTLRVVAVHADEAALYLEVRACSDQAACPLCGQPSQQVHSQYVRQPPDLPWVGTPLRLRLHVRRFRCCTPDCRRQIFTERLPTLLRPSARATLRLEAARQALVLTSGGEAGARLSAHLGLPSSPDQLLRVLQHTPVPDRPTPRVLGFDEWAWRKRRRYGTILVDLETHQVVDLLPDDQRATITAWLQAHPGVEVISRDRSGPFALAATEGAPQARQVADRFHLLVRRFTRHSIPVRDGKGYKGDLWDNDLPGGESQRGQEHVV
jgi:transposase